MSSNHFLALKEVIDAIDESANPAASMSAMIVFLLSGLKTLDSDLVSDAICEGFKMYEEGLRTTA